MTAPPVRGKWLQRSWLVGTLVVGLLAAPFAASDSPDEGQSAAAAEVPSKVLPDPTAAMAGYFIENVGQATDGVRFYTTGNPSLAFLDDGVMFVISEKRRSGLGLEDIPARQSPGLGPTADISRSPTSHAYLIRFEGANRILPAGNDELSFHSNFFTGADSGLWRKGVRNYGEVVYSALYDGVTLAYHVTPQGTKYEFLVERGGDPSRIVMTYSGVDSIGLDRGDLVVLTPLGEVRDSAPVAFQGRDAVSCTFVLRAPRSVGFACASRDPSRLLVIDPLIYSTFLGGPGYGGCISIDVGPQGNAYLTGWRDAPGFPVTPGAVNRTYHGGEEAFIAELDATGGSLVYATYIGGSGDDRGYALVLDPGGFAVITGRTNSPDFPVTAGAFSTSYGGGGVFGDAFITKLSPDGSALAYSSYLGGSSDDTASGITLDTVEDVYITGETYSDDFPVTPGAFQGTMKASSAAFVAKLDPTGSALAYSTFLAGSAFSEGVGVKVDVAGNAYVFGFAGWRDFPVTQGAFDTTFDGASDAFVTKLNPAGTGLVYSTFLGGSRWEVADAMRLDAFGSAYLVGLTASPDFPVTPGAYSTVYHIPGVSEGDGFVTKLNPTGTALVYSTFLGGTDWDEIFGIALDSSGNAYLSGTTISADFPTTPDALNRRLQNQDGFVAELDFRGSALLFSTLLGGYSTEATLGIQVDAARDVYTAGWTYSSDFPVTPAAFDRSRSGSPDGFVAKLGIPTGSNTLPRLFWTGAPQ